MAVNPLHIGFSIFISIILLAITINSLIVYGKSTAERKKFWRFVMIGFLLLFLQSIIIFIPISVIYADGVITFKLILTSIAYLIIGFSFVLHTLDNIRSKTSKSKKRRK
jgi:hypothetical protein